MKADKNLIGAAGEHLVLSRLLSKEILAAPAPRGTRKADILVMHLDAGEPSLIQVKTQSGPEARKTWMMSKKHEEETHNHFFYCFVDMNNEFSKIYVIPSIKVATVIKEDYRVWLATPGKNGREHKATDMRTLCYHYDEGLKSAPIGWMDEYLERWDLI
jgi:hypothetical protein